MIRLARALTLVTLLAIAAALIPMPGTASATWYTPKPIFVDTDIGVDDAVAIAWLLKQRQAQVVGFTTVFGNATVENATRNLLTLLDVANREGIPVTIGASEPLELPRTGTGPLVHGPDGLWFGQQPFDISGLPTGGGAAIAAAAAARPGLTIVALGPLTNIAEAIALNPTAMASARIIALGGGTRGNRTPVAEFNIYADPHALDAVLSSGVVIDLVTLDAFDQLRVDIEDFTENLADDGGAVGQFLSAILGPYFQALQTGGESDEGGIPDAAAMIYALQPNLATSESGLVRVITDTGYARGLTVIATTISNRIPLLATDAELSALAEQAFSDPNFDLNIALFGILTREPDNVNVILDINERSMARILERNLTR